MSSADLSARIAEEAPALPPEKQSAVRYNPKSTHMSQSEQQKKTKGTVIAEEIRKQANFLSDAEREKLLDEARALMHGGDGKGKARAHRH